MCSPDWACYEIWFCPTKLYRLAHLLLSSNITGFQLCNRINSSAICQLSDYAIVLASLLGWTTWALRNWTKRLNNAHVDGFIGHNKAAAHARRLGQSQSCIYNCYSEAVSIMFTAIRSPQAYMHSQCTAKCMSFSLIQRIKHNKVLITLNTIIIKLFMFITNANAFGWQLDHLVITMFLCECPCERTNYHQPSACWHYSNSAAVRHCRLFHPGHVDPWSLPILHYLCQFVRWTGEESHCCLYQEKLYAVLFWTE